MWFLKSHGEDNRRGEGEQEKSHTPGDPKGSCVWWRQLLNVVQEVCMPSVPIKIGIDGNYNFFNDPCSGIGEVFNGGSAPVQHGDVCNFLNDTKLSVMNSFTNNLHPHFAGGVPTYVPKNGNVSEATCIDHFLSSREIKCTPHSIAQCQELMHPQKHLIAQFE